MTTVALILIAAPIGCFIYAYLIYPALLLVLSTRRPPVRRWEDPPDWPFITITVPAYNEEQRIRETIESLLAIDYPADRRQILIVSDASTDTTDSIVMEFADRGVELFRVARRGGKTNAENLASSEIRGAIVVNTDASIRVLPHSVKALVRAFGDPAVAVASGRDVSVGDETYERNRGESGYVGYEMWVRDLETRLWSIVGASGCCYAARAEVQRVQLPTDLARDFASALIAREHRWRAVSVADATCIVPRTSSLAAELRRKVRTMAQGLETLWYKRALMDPFRYGGFSFMLISHKLCRWLFSLLLPFALVGLLLAGTVWRPAMILLAVVVFGAAVGYAVLRMPAEHRVPAPIALMGFVLVSNLAGVLAWLKVLRRERIPTWEPTRRPNV